MWRRKRRVALHNIMKYIKGNGQNRIPQQCGGQNDQTALAMVTVVVTVVVTAVVMAVVAPHRILEEWLQ